METVVQNFKATRCYAELAKIVDDYTSDGGNAAKHSKIAQMKDKAIAVCTAHGYLTTQHYHVKQVGGTPMNRDNEGISWHRAHSRLEVIKASGFSNAAMEDNRIALQDNPYTREFAKYTAGLSKISKHFATYQEDVVQAGTLGASHCTHGFACVLDEVPCETPAISANGRISKAKVSNVY